MSSMSTPNNRRPSYDIHRSGDAPGAPRKRVALPRPDSDRIVPAMPPPQVLSERDIAARFLYGALKEIRDLTQQAAHLAQLNQDAELRADANERAYHDAFAKLAAHERWECAAQCCEGPVTELLYRLADCRHFVCQSYINAKVRARRNTVGVASNAEEKLRIPCPLCAGVPQNVNVFAPAIPFASDISPMGALSVSRDGVNKLLQHVSTCGDLATFAEGRNVRELAFAMQPQPNSVCIDFSDDDDDEEIPEHDVSEFTLCVSPPPDRHSVDVQPGDFV